MAKIKAFILGICLLFAGTCFGYDSPVAQDNCFASVHQVAAIEYPAVDIIEYAAPTADELRLQVAETYNSFIGVREATGRNDGAEVKMFLAVTGFAEGNPWCAAFAAYCFTVNDIPNPKSAWSPAWFPKYATIDHNREIPKQADVFGLYNNSLGRIAHAGFVDRWPRDADFFLPLKATRIMQDHGKVTEFTKSEDLNELHTE
jgi:hypothetical protein